MIAIQLLGYANGKPLAVAGNYIMTVDVQKAGLSLDWLSTTPSVEEAKTWPSIDAALLAYREVPDYGPIREDGEPNRPLTAFTAVFVVVEEVRETSECSFGNDS